MAGSDPVSPVKSPDRVTGVTVREWTQPTNQRPVWVTSDQSEGEGRGRGMSVAGAGVVTSVVSESVRVQSSPKPEPRADSGRAENIINNTDKYNNLQWLPRREISRGYLRSKINCYWYRGEMISSSKNVRHSILVYIREFFCFVKFDTIHVLTAKAITQPGRGREQCWKETETALCALY